MSVVLEEYQRKRDFTKTPEPSGQKRAKPADGSKWHSLPEGHRFCVQMHKATRMHWDVRLEWNGVLLSWAVPRGPSLDPAKKRLAVQTEDHPIDYGDFEGVIPSGYGMGTVELWDVGTYEWVRESLEDPDHQLKKGDVKFALHGNKLSGEFALVRIGERGKRYGGSSEGDKNYLMIKKKDGAVIEKYEAIEHDVSVKTGRTLAEIAAGAGGDPREMARIARAAAKPRPAATGTSKRKEHGLPAISQIPQPMLATTVSEPFDRAGWIYELKYDGVRAVVAVANGEVKVVGRHGRDETARYPEAQLIPSYLKCDSAIMDSEIVVLDEHGLSNFERLQSRINVSGGSQVARAAEKEPAVFAAFDLLALDGRSLLDTDLRIRKKTLREILKDGGPLLFADHVDTEGKAFFAAVQQQGAEGIIAKRGDSKYQPGVRSRDWLKIKAWLTQSCVIAGWTQGRGTRGQLGALVLGIRDGNELVHCGSAGSGLSGKAMRELLQKLKPATTKKCPLVKEPKLSEPVTWVEPSIVCEVRHAGWTNAGILRHPTFLGLRPELNAADCVRETAVATQAAIKQAESANPESAHSEPAVTTPAASDDDIAFALQQLKRLGETGNVAIAGHEVHVTNLNKIYWPESGYTKRDMIAYYIKISNYLVPYLAARPLSMQIFPDGIYGKSFWRKDKPAHSPEWIDAWTYHGEEKTKTYVVVNNAATLVWAANAAAVDLHPWHSRIDEPNNPDWAVFDLDPFEPATFDDVKDIARYVQAALGHYNLKGYIKTSGQTGLQIYVPIIRGPNYDKVRGWVEEVGRTIGQLEPDRISWEWTVRNRTGKIRIDYTQNIINKTLAAPYSLRPAPGAPVSTPIAWEELDDKRLRPDRWNIKNIEKRLQEVGDLFSGLLKPDQHLPQ